MPATSPLAKRLVTDRNRAWAPKIEELANSGTNAIVIVGTGHLIGTDGVVDLMRKRGFKITQESRRVRVIFPQEIPIPLTPAAAIGIVRDDFERCEP